MTKSKSLVWRGIEELVFPAALLRGGMQAFMYWFRTLDEPGETEYSLRSAPAVDVDGLSAIERYRIQTSPTILGLYLAWLWWFTVPLEGGLALSIVGAYLAVNWLVLTFWDPIVGGLAMVRGWL